MNNNGQIIDKNENTPCGKCGKEVNVRIGWVDPYNNRWYVHYDCLSDKRKKVTICDMVAIIKYSRKRH